MNRYTQLSYKDITAEVTAYRDSKIVLLCRISTLLRRITMSILKQQLVKYRTLQKHSEHDTLSVSLPVQWTRLLGLRKADNVVLKFEDNRRIVVEAAD
jgi:hypothetical protein